MEIEPIGLVHSCYLDRFGTPRQPGLVPESEATIEIFAKYQPEFSLEGLDGFSHLWVIFHFHQNTNVRFKAKIHPPRLNGKSVGVFATRSPHRPNELGLSLVEIVKIDQGRIVVRGHDLVDQTPVLDIKPYIPAVEAKPEAKAGWSENLPIGGEEVQFEWSDVAKSGLNGRSRPPEELQALIESTLKLDPRPLVYKGYEGDRSKYRDVHAVRIFDLDTHFMFRSPSLIEVIEIKG